MNRFIFRGLIIISLLIPVAVACNEGSCFDETESYLKGTFYTTSANGKSLALAPDSVSMHGLGIDSLIYEKSNAIKVVKMPLNSSAESSKFILKINNLTDTIEIRYRSYPHLISKECGYTYFHRLIDKIINSNDSITYNISDSTITNLNIENIKIFY